jgi:hypothetical protein
MHSTCNNNVMHNEGETSFDPVAIYNPVYEEKLEEERKEKEKVSGQLWEKDGTKLVSKENGQFLRITKASHAQLEEDLSSMISESEREEIVLSTERHKQLFSEACFQVTRLCRMYMDGADIRKVFPGIDVHNLKGYDFSNALVKVFVLSPKNFEIFEDAYGIKDEAVRHNPASAHIFINSWRTSRKTSESGLTDVEEGKSPNSLVVLREIQNIKVDFNSFDKESVENLVELERDLSKTMRHELFHALGVGEGFPSRISEGIVESYARITRNKGEPPRKKDSYISEASIVLGLVSLSQQEGLDEHLASKVFFGTASKKEDLTFIKMVKKNFGEEFVGKFFIKGFADKEDTRKAAHLVWDRVE